MSKSMSAQMLRSVVKSAQGVNTLRTLHWVAKAVYRAQGYRWEIRRNGEIKLGYWRKTLRKKDQRSPYPKRFVLVPGFGDTQLSWYWVVLLLQPVLARHYDELILLDFP